MTTVRSGRFIQLKDKLDYFRGYADIDGVWWATPCAKQLYPPIGNVKRFATREEAMAFAQMENI